MKQIIRLLISIKFWTVIGVLASGVLLYYKITDKTEVSSLTLGVGDCKLVDDDEDGILIINFYDNVPAKYDWNQFCFLSELPLSVFNVSGNTVKNVQVVYVIDESKAYNYKSKSSSLDVSLSYLYYLDESGEYLPVRNYDNVSFDDMPPKRCCQIIKNQYCTKYTGDEIHNNLITFDVMYSADSTPIKTKRVYIIPYISNGDVVDKPKMVDAITQFLRTNNINIKSNIFFVYQDWDRNKGWQHINDFPFISTVASWVNILDMSI